VKIDQAELASYKQQLNRRGRRFVVAALILAVGVGYAISLISSLLVGAAVALVLLVLGEYAWVYSSRAELNRRFPGSEWSYEGLLVKYLFKRSAAKSEVGAPGPPIS